ncbi:hypothetical protein A3I27_00020 [Candidatus Giovannonibacteria bacterium RIFCSPLOWO2_02_FULL_43_11b]|uniref:ATP synthase F1 complex delta/epsilon subunit N-terminal domain-containing protein n=1 Tax=Candidatus Giovannonibacteria bacterium RIFCSPHIGHO2_12_FULL_43_15 TaxID=1798341 RepID=A0A1F5WNR7_9BACT|nr:MAG: hypothetical protein A2739_00390 [Candidatus Giovannonibacteria bacterium RIFCSPHIGHO2_01_FULL_43_100]OGF67564.1 MAG: hypothetical protein A3B97_00670 [Candidatus Giovannonibacteria bacterium RIFCSPHIGHO2_02_FULL_43_32]OGF77237.1 MAG: hypothetical protein A3F23_03140 [Candidatus Giovannonibacteria bacterium RIFCSPHIGHO2_12_FULL_43_15]OGF79064.1 MAG: hypothetical protein A3A15_03650 [Candidatus Giovannonibacteria bacterium RIFCSPLOWO2_01_FULL_43_60]OGF90643.1 MAG: hypothetical protein A3
MKLTIYSLRGVEFEGNAMSFNVKTKSGEITLLDHHRPLITLLEEGAAKIGLLDQSVRNFEIKSGFLEMDDHDNLSILAD